MRMFSHQVLREIANRPMHPHHIKTSEAEGGRTGSTKLEASVPADAYGARFRTCGMREYVPARMIMTAEMRR